MSFLRSRSSETSVGMNNLFDTSNCLYYLCALFSVVQLSVPLTYYIFVFFLGPIQGVFYVGKDEFITWRWNAMYNRREYWHTVINAAMVFCWFLEIKDSKFGFWVYFTPFSGDRVCEGIPGLLIQWSDIVQNSSTARFADPRLSGGR